ncbi:MAG: sensor domain-containing diguanylate cyclase [Massilia sp.]|nr:sensor domain-containing diguanylate cyclase [Massilia sp.]
MNTVTIADFEIDIVADHEALLQFLYLAPVGLIQATMNGDIQLINPLSAQLLMPLAKEGMLSNLFDVLESVAPELRLMVSEFPHESGTVCEWFRAHLSAGIQGKRDARVLGISLIKLDANRLMAVLNDFSQQVAQERQLKHNAAWLNAVSAGIADYALIPLDETGLVEEWNAGIGRLTKFSADDIVGQPYSVFYPAASISSERMRDFLCEAEEDGWSLSEGWRIKADGERFWCSSMIVPVEDFADVEEAAALLDHKASGYALILRDITDQQKDMGEHVRTMYCDYLTGLSNRRALFEAAELEFKRWHRNPRPLSLIAIDADFFKKVNDTFGHAAGDLVLRQISLALKESARDIDTVARIGGEEFAVLLPSTDIEGALALAERFRKRVEADCVTVEGAQIRYTVSVGVSTMDQSVTSFDDLLARADKALFDAKHGGRNRVVAASAPCIVSVAERA